ncbi:MAG TPA: winged helix-turn-helix domain-containing protein [Caulobacteraceae bacterium]
MRVDDAPVDIEVKPLEILIELLTRAGEVVTKGELLEAVWPGLAVVEGSLPTAVSKLRRALGDERQTIVVTVPRVGYRLDGPVQILPSHTAADCELGLAPGSVVPGRGQWRLTRRLDHSGGSEVWLAEYPKTGEARVFKFAADAMRLRALKREVALSRLLHETLSERADFVRVLEWNFQAPPYFIESEYGGADLIAWAAEQGSLNEVPLMVRLTLMANVARSVAAAHGAGVLHKDLKPSNVLVSPDAGGGWRTRVADFGSGWVTETSRLDALQITDPGFGGAEGMDGGSLSGTMMYLAPEVLAGHAPMAAADVYALGVMLYQMVVGDLRRPLTAGWEADVADPLLRSDIAEAAAGDPARRLRSAAELAERLSRLGARRAELLLLEQEQARVSQAEHDLQKTRARRPWVVASLTLLLIGAAGSTALYAQAAQERDHARRESAIAEAISQFLAVDLLGRANPFKNGAPDESLVGAVEAVSPDIDRRFDREPAVAAQLHQSIARALDRRSEWAGARREYDRAVYYYKLAGGAASQDTTVVGLQRAMMEARSYEQASLPRAKAMLAEQEARIAALRQVRPDVAVWRASARGMVDLISDDAAGAARNFKEASDRAERLPAFDETTRLTFKQRLAFAHIRLGDGKTAESLFRSLISDYTDLEGADSPNVLMVRLNLAQALMIQGEHEAAIREANAVYPAFLARLGATHELTLQLLSTRAQSEGTLMRWDDAIRDDLAVHEIAVAKQGPKSFFAVASLADLATAQCRSGRLAQGLGDAEQAYRTAKAGFGDKAALTQAAGFSWASCLVAVGRLQQAEVLLKPIDAGSVAQLAGDPDWGANLALARAQIAFNRKNYVAARKELPAAAPLAGAKADPYQRKALADLTSALSEAG